MRRSFLSVLAAVVATMLVIAVVAGAGPASRPFKGSMSGTATFVLDEDCLPFGFRSESQATGTASHLGKMTMTSVHCSGVVFTGQMTLVAANGDKVFADYETVGPPVFPGDVGDVFAIPLEFTITGGSGRFQNAVGSGKMTAHIVTGNFGPGEVWSATWDLQGTIGY